MNQELTDKLYNEFPKLFRYYKEKTNPIIPMAFGFECNDGWFPIIRLCAKMIKHEAEQNNLDAWAFQVKEKFGGLRFYIEGANEKIYDIISFFESLSYNVCEDCGTTVNVETGTHKGAWIRTLCTKCIEK